MYIIYRLKSTVERGMCFKHANSLTRRRNLGYSEVASQLMLTISARPIFNFTWHINN